MQKESLGHLMIYSKVHISKMRLCMFLKNQLVIIAQEFLGYILSASLL